jgi:hypothetical protein
MLNPYVLFLTMTIIFVDAGASFLPSFKIICSVVSEEKIFEED